MTECQLLAHRANRLSKSTDTYIAAGKKGVEKLHIYQCTFIVYKFRENYRQAASSTNSLSKFRANSLLKWQLAYGSSRYFTDERERDHCYLCVAYLHPQVNFAVPLCPKHLRCESLHREMFMRLSIIFTSALETWAE